MRKRLCRLCGVVFAVAFEPCIHLIGVRYGVHIPHPEGLGAQVMNLLVVTND